MHVESMLRLELPAQQIADRAQHVEASPGPRRQVDREDLFNHGDLDNASLAVWIGELISVVVLGGGRMLPAPGHQPTAISRPGRSGGKERADTHAQPSLSRPIAGRLHPRRSASKFNHLL